jgi:predicted transcriptional regulator
VAVSVGLKLEKDVKTRLKRLGQLRDRSPHWLMREAIVAFLDREERLEREKREDQERWENYVLTGESIPHDEMVKWLHAFVGKKSRTRRRAA